MPSANVINPTAYWAFQCLVKTPGLTQAELGRAHSPTDPRKIGRRMIECERFGLAIRGEKRGCSVSGKTSVTWWPVVKKLPDYTREEALEVTGFKTLRELVMNWQDLRDEVLPQTHRGK